MLYLNNVIKHGILFYIFAIYVEIRTFVLCFS